MTSHLSRSSIKVLVTGAAGFIGRYVVTTLINEGFIVRRHLGPSSKNEVSHARELREAEADICDGEAFRALTSGMDMVVHLAGSPSVADSFEHATEYNRVHVQGTICVLDACRHSDVKKFIYVSSAEVYGRPEMEVVSEGHRLQARSPYAAAKIGAEAIVTAYQAAYGLHAIVLRPFSVYGPGAPAQSLISEVIARAISKEQVVVRDLRPVRDYCFVGDVAGAIVKACCFEGSPELLIFNIGTMRGSSVAEVCRLLLGVLGKSELPISADVDLRPGTSEIYRLVSDNTRAQSILRWAPTVTLEEGLRITAEAYRR